MSRAAARVVSFLPDEHLLVGVSVERFAGGYRVEVAGAARVCACPKCGVVSARVHARFVRRVRDLPVQGERVIVSVQHEVLDTRTWRTRDELRSALFVFLAITYDRERRHSSVSYRILTEFNTEACAKLTNVH